ncbi:hypothetical protein SAMN04488067_1025 [Halorubrum xinjiangense]|uniref:Peptidoglycan-binding protein n=1 Tax=Halorubrum xinjiangense TaxID=261291 RepID=A0A1G7IDF6_9EURY|nr:DUF5822 domain-containing protein [Halorubrum xinjiangense]SDF10741.1 hypothetical protein SAMN04488067_1025 [Halorubrum xinjiangense]
MQPVERAEYEGVDYAWVMQTTFVVTIIVGAPVAALLSTLVTLESWGARAAFAVRVGAPIWFVTAVAVALYARRTEAGDGGSDEDTAGGVGGASAEATDERAEPTTGERAEPTTGERAEPTTGERAEPTTDETERTD